MTSTSGTEPFPLVPERGQHLEEGTPLYVIAEDSSRCHQEIGHVVYIDEAGPPDIDDEYMVNHDHVQYGYIDRSCVSLTMPPLNLPASLDPEEVSRWLDQ